MRFRTKDRPRGVLRRSDQRRLTLIVLGLGLVMVGFAVVRRPQFWSHLFPGHERPAADVEPGVPVVPERSAAAESNRLRADEFLVGDSNSGLPAEASGAVVANRIPFDEDAVNGNFPRSADVALPNVSQDLLKSVKDDVIGVHSAEDQAYFASMKLAEKIEQRRTLNAPRGAYALFMDSPAGARGIAWTITGQLRRLSEVKGKTNAFGVGMLYDAWITTPDSGDHLVHVIAMKAAPELADLISVNNVDRSIDLMDKNAPDVTFTGYFFKREGYASSSAEGLSLAPMFLTGTLHDVPEISVASSRAEQLTPYLGWLAFAICLSIALIVATFWASDARHTETRAHQLTKLPAHVTFEDVSAVTVSEALEELQSPGTAET